LSNVGVLGAAVTGGAALLINTAEGETIFERNPLLAYLGGRWLAGMLLYLTGLEEPWSVDERSSSVPCVSDTS
jgi:hypothetical protein